MMTTIIILIALDILLGITALWFFKTYAWYTRDAIDMYKKQAETSRKQALVYKLERNQHIDRRVDLETALLWWVNERMKGFSDDQYGKGKLKELIEKNKLIDISKVSE